MDLPSTRELELETLLRQRDVQLRETQDELSRLRLYLNSQPAPSPSEPITVPPALLALILPHLKDSTTPAEHGTQSGSRTVTAALVQRAKILQEENDELYDILKSDETGKLKEQVRTLTRVVERLEVALTESHQIIQTLTTELDKTYDSIASRAPKPPTGPRSPATSYHSLPVTNQSTSKLPPTGPRAYKKPRLSESPHLQRPLPPQSHGSSYRPRDKDRERERDRSRSRSRSRSRNGYRNGKSKMDVDEDGIEHGRTSRGKDRQKGKEDRERDRDRDKRRRSGGGSKRADKSSMPPGHPSFGKGDRTLAERMGLS